MNIDACEQQYRRWLEAFQTGQMDEAAFVAAVDGLAFLDEWGHAWMMGARSGRWYYYDGRRWKQAEPRQADRLPVVDEAGSYWRLDRTSGRWQTYDSQTGQWLTAAPVETTPPAASPSPEPTPVAAAPAGNAGPAALSARSIFALSTILVLFLALLVWPVGSAPPIDDPAVAPSPRPPIGGSGGSGGGGSDSEGGGGGGPSSAIFGTVTDVNTGRPGAGIEVSVNGQIVRTDTDGSYSITGLPAGEYNVSPQLHGQGEPAQGPKAVNLDGQNEVTLDLGYYSDTQPVPTDTPQPSLAVAAETMAATPPPSLPAAGGPPSGAAQPQVLVVLGLLCLLCGGVMFKLATGAQTKPKV